MDTTVSMAELARIAGVSRTTVSLALRNHPSISEVRRKEIKALAKKHNYIVDPELSSLARSIRRRSEKESPSIAGLFFMEPEEAGAFAPYVTWNYRTLIDEVRKRGYQLQEFHVHRDKISPRAVQRILLARGINGVILGAHDPNDAFVGDFDFRHFACASPLVDPRPEGLPSVGSNHYQGTLLALEEIWKRGYRKPGLLIFTDEYLQNWRWREGAFAFFSYQKKIKLPPPVLLSKWSDNKILGWMEKHRPDVLITPFSQTLATLQERGLSIPQDMGFVSLHLLDPNCPDIAGIDDREEIRMGALIDLVIDQLNRNVRGRQEDPPRIFTSGKWVDGKTLPFRGA